jgi:hypothetical protein
MISYLIPQDLRSASIQSQTIQELSQLTHVGRDDTSQVHPPLAASSRRHLTHTSTCYSYTSLSFLSTTNNIVLSLLNSSICEISPLESCILQQCPKQTAVLPQGCFCSDSERTYEPTFWPHDKQCANTKSTESAVSTLSS